MPFSLGDLLYLLAGLWLACKKFRKDYLWLILPPAVFFAAALFAKVQIGYRHIMPVMPFLAVLAGLALARLPTRPRAKPRQSPRACN